MRTLLENWFGVAVIIIALGWAICGIIETCRQPNDDDDDDEGEA